MTTPKTWPGIIKAYQRYPKEIQQYFGDFENLVKSYSWDIVITYLFSLVESAHSWSIYCGCVKRYKVDSDLARKGVDNQHMTRQKFQDLHESILGKALPNTATNNLKHAEKIRDKILHGKKVTEKDKRTAVICILEYAKAFNEFTKKEAGFQPFGSRTGFKGRATSLDRPTSRLVLKGLGFENFQ